MQNSIYKIMLMLPVAYRAMLGFAVFTIFTVLSLPVVVCAAAEEASVGVGAVKSLPIDVESDFNALTSGLSIAEGRIYAYQQRTGFHVVSDVFEGSVTAVSQRFIRFRGFGTHSAGELQVVLLREGYMRYLVRQQWRQRYAAVASNIKQQIEITQQQNDFVFKQIQGPFQEFKGIVRAIAIGDKKTRIVVEYRFVPGAELQQELPFSSMGQQAPNDWFAYRYGLMLLKGFEP